MVYSSGIKGVFIFQPYHIDSEIYHIFFRNDQNYYIASHISSLKVLKPVFYSFLNVHSHWDVTISFPWGGRLSFSGTFPMTTLKTLLVGMGCDVNTTNDTVNPEYFWGSSSNTLVSDTVGRMWVKLQEYLATKSKLWLSKV